MGCRCYEIEYPEDTCRLDQDEEWVLVKTEGNEEKIRIHEYDRFYQIPGLYEEVVYKRLKCSSPRVVCELLKTELAKKGEESRNLRTLDFGAGNGIVGECLKQAVDCSALVGIDIIPEARKAAERDRPGVYDEYYVMDLCEIDKSEEAELEKWNFNALITVAALGYDDIPTRAFLNAFNLLDTGAWVAFNIRDKFLSDSDKSGYRETLEMVLENNLTVFQKKHYCHRFSLSGEPLHYYAIVGKKKTEAKTAAVDTPCSPRQIRDSAHGSKISTPLV
jgi:hypothetical protein